MKKIFKVHVKDNVYIVKAPMLAGELLGIPGMTLKAAHDLDRGHKIAAQQISKGEKVIKFGLSIGSAVREISVGEHVHLHNLRSDYLPTFSTDVRYTK